MTAAIREDSIAIRRYLHANPELSCQEEETTRFLEKKLTEYGIDYRLNPAGFGLVARLEGGEPGPVIAFRSDIDALPITEESGAAFCSGKPGVMHACGHDFHMTILLGLARLLAGRRGTIKGSVVFIFQPNEENYPGGAKPLIDTGLLEDVDCYFGLHIAPDFKVGQIGLRVGPTMASPTTFHITIHGKSGHGAKPQESVDPIVTACQVVTALQTIVSRNVEPFGTAVVSVCHIEGGATHNVIPEYAHMTGTIRTFSDEVLSLIETRMAAITEGICQAMGAACEVQLDRGYPVVDNQPGPTAAVEAAARYAGYEVCDKEPFMVGEDFSYYINHRTGCFFHLGVAGSSAESHVSLHNAHLLPDEEALFCGMEILLAAYYHAVDMNKEEVGR